MAELASEFKVPPPFSTYLPTNLPTYLPTYPPTYYPPTYLSTYLPAYLPTYLTNLKHLESRFPRTGFPQDVPFKVCEPSFHPLGML